MANFGRTTSSVAVPNQDMFKSYSGLAHQASTITVYLPAFFEATHYPDGFIKPGTILAKHTGGAGDTLYGPLIHDSVTNGEGNSDAMLLEAVWVEKAQDGTVVGDRSTASALVAGVPVQVFVSKLPGLLEDDDTTAHAPVAGDLPSAFINADDA